MRKVTIQASRIVGEDVFKLVAPSNVKIEEAVFVEFTDDDLNELTTIMYGEL